MKKNKLIWALGLILLLAGHWADSHAQTVALRTNLVFWAAEGANIGADLAINDYQSVGVTALATLGDSWVKHINMSGMQLDYKFWLTRKMFQGVFFGPQVGLYHYRLDEPSDVLRHTALSAGLEGGYGWMLNRYWNVDVVYGAGYLLYAAPAMHHRFITTNIGVNISYVF